jgi:hypothetical protein
MVFKMSYGANDVPVPQAVTKVAAVKKAAPRRRAVKPTLTDQAQALFDPHAAPSDDAADLVAEEANNVPV